MKCEKKEEKALHFFTEPKVTFSNCLVGPINCPEPQNITWQWQRKALLMFGELQAEKSWHFCSKNDWWLNWLHVKFGWIDPLRQNTHIEGTEKEESGLQANREDEAEDGDYDKGPDAQRLGHDDNNDQCCQESHP